VRDVATAHVEAMIRPEANGKRFILDGNEPPIPVNALIAKCRTLFPAIEFHDAPGPKGWDADLYGAMGFPHTQPTGSSTDNTQSRTVLGLRYMPMDETIADTLASIIDNGFVPTTPSSKL